MANAIIYDPSHAIVANKVTSLLESVHTPDYEGNANTLINPSLTAVASVAFKYWKVSGSDVVEMTTQEKTDIDNDEAAQAAQAEADAKDFTVTYDKLEKAFALVVLDEFNAVRGWLKDFKAEVASATSLGDLQTRVAGLPAMNDRTQSQLKTAVSDKYDTL